MNEDRDVEGLLAVEPVDAGCAAGFEVLHRYVEPASSHPGLAAHLVSCPACRQDYLGLIEAAETFGDAHPSAP